MFSAFAAFATLTFSHRTWRIARRMELTWGFLLHFLFLWGVSFVGQNGMMSCVSLGSHGHSDRRNANEVILLQWPVRPW